MTREEAINEINKVFTSAYANYIVTALTEGATVSDIQRRWGRAYEAGVKDGLEQEPKWIPVTERLPEEMFGCLVTVWDANPKTGEEFENILPEFAGYDGETWNGADGKPIAFEVVAWMPSPEPYNEDKE